MSDNEGNNPVPIYTTGAPGVPSERITPSPDVKVFSAHTGNQLPSLPDFGTPTDAPNPTGSNRTYHGGIQTTDSHGNTIYMVHRSEE